MVRLPKRGQTSFVGFVHQTKRQHMHAQPGLLVAPMQSSQTNCTLISPDKDSKTEYDCSLAGVYHGGSHTSSEAGASMMDTTAMEPASLSSNSSGTPLSSPWSSASLSTPWTDADEEDFVDGHHRLNLHDQASPSWHDRTADEYRNNIQQPIAIIGMACRLPGGVSNPAEFWELCTRARSGFSQGVPKDRFDHDAFYHPNPGKMGCYHAAGGYFLNEDVSAFDAPFFNLTEKEALAMDPQQRLLLECTFEAFESAGIAKHMIVGRRVGVFIGGSLSEYETHLSRDSETIPIHQATGCAQALQSNRISHYFDLRGPSFTVDTACSSSLTALHVACQSLRLGESTAAIAGGCHLNLLPESFVSFSTSRLLSDSGRSIPFDERGTGFGRGEGCGIVVLKPLDRALRDKDPIRAVIYGTGINQDGKTAGITMPNGDAQEKLIREVYEAAGLDPADCGFVEAHGTGTKIGDPTEAEALYRSLGKERTPRNPLYIGSVKSNIGHLEAASGVSAVIKAALMLERNFILPNHDFKKPNPKIPWKEWNIKVPTTQRPWPRGKKYVSVNNFGFGGTNAHVVLGKAPSRVTPGDHEELSTPPSESEVPWGSSKLFVLSGNDKQSLSSVMKQLVIYLEQRPEIFQSELLNNLAYSLGRRALLKWRVAIPAATSFDLIESLNSNKVIMGKTSGMDPQIGFVFTGQGAQWYGMGRELYGQYPAYTIAMDRADKYLKALGAAWSLTDELCNPQDDTGESQLSKAHISQPACTAVQLCLVDLLRSWGIRPAAVVGHSSGEIAAAYAAGSITFRAAMAIAYHRGRVIPALKRKFPQLNGAMMAVGMTKDDIQPLIDALPGQLETRLTIACYNSPSSLTISGDAEAIGDLELVIKKMKPEAFHRLLQVDVAYHSHHMDLIAQDYRDSLTGSFITQAKSRASGVRFYSSLFGRRISGLECNVEYWVRNLTNPVRFSEALENMLIDTRHENVVDTSLPAPRAEVGEEINVLIELGPHSALQGPIKQILKASRGTANVTYGSALIRKRTAVDSVMELASSLISHGASFDLNTINFPFGIGKKTTLLTDLPRYPWNHEKRYWYEVSRLAQMHRHRSGVADGLPLRSSLIGLEAVYSNPVEPTWRNIVSLDNLSWLRHHQIQGLIIFPISGFIIMALEAASQVWARQQNTKRTTTETSSSKQIFDSFELHKVQVLKPLAIPTGDEDDHVEMTISLRRQYGPTLQKKDWDGWQEFRICSWSRRSGWTEHCIGLVGSRHIFSSEEITEHVKPDLIHQSSFSVPKEFIDGSLNATKGVGCTNTSKMYQLISELGVSYGSAFQGITACHASNGVAVGNIAATDIAQPDNMAIQAPGCGTRRGGPNLHPTLLEAIFEMYWPIVVNPSTASDLNSKNDTIFLPSAVEHIRISHKVESSKTMNVYCQADVNTIKHRQPTTVDLFATFGTEKLKELDNELLVEIHGLTISPISDGCVAETHQSNIPRKLCYQLDWEPLPVNQVDTQSLFANSDVTIIYGEHSEMSYRIGSQLVNALEPIACSLPKLVPLLEMNNPVTNEISSKHSKQKICISLAEIETSFLSHASNAQFEAVQQMIAQYEDGILWVTRGAFNNATSPESNMISGLSRSVRSETSMSFATLDLDGHGNPQDIESAIRAITIACQAAFAATMHESGSAPSVDRGLEFVERGGTIITPRIVDDNDMNTYVHNQMTEIAHTTLELRPFLQSDRPLRMQNGVKGDLSPFHFVDDTEVANLPLKDDEIEFEVRAVGTSGNDTNIFFHAQDELDTGCSNKLTWPLGVEAAGTISRTGASVDVSSFRPGNRIVGLTVPRHGGFATLGRTTSSTAMLVPDEMPFEQAAAIPVAYFTAYYSLVTQAHLEVGERVLIASAAGAVGQAAVCIALELGASIIITTETPEERQELVELYDGMIASQNILAHNSRESSSIDSLDYSIRHMTDGEGVDVFLDLTSDSTINRQFETCLASFGRFVQVSQEQVHAHPNGRGHKTVNSIIMPSSAPSAAAPYKRGKSSNISTIEVDMANLAAKRPETLSRVVSSVARMLSLGKVRPVKPLSVFSFSDAQAAFEMLQKRTDNAPGKVVLAPHDHEQVMCTVERNTTSEQLLKKNATYLIAGGTGGLGRSMARWMATHGAGTIVLLSRHEEQRMMDTSSFIGERVRRLMDEARADGATVLVRQCDVANDASVKALLSNGLTGLPPLRGIIHSAMVLRDVLFDKMSWTDYTNVIQSKVHGARNLHEQTLPKDGDKSGLITLDFFILVSSIAGIVGNRGQAAYSASNTYLDALVQYRRSLGLPAASLALTAVSDAGYLADDGSGAGRAAEVARNLGGNNNTMCEAEVLAMLQAAISAEGRKDGTTASSHDGVYMTGLYVGVSKASKTVTRPFWATDAKFKTLMAADAGEVEEAAATQTISLDMSLSQAEAEDVVCRGLVIKIAQVLMLEAEDLDVTRSLSQYPLDSLVAIEIRNFIAREYEANMQVLELLSSGSIQTLSAAVCRKSKLCGNWN